MGNLVGESCHGEQWCPQSSTTTNCVYWRDARNGKVTRSSDTDGLVKPEDRIVRFESAGPGPSSVQWLGPHEVVFGAELDTWRIAGRIVLVDSPAVQELPTEGAVRLSFKLGGGEINI
jgi:hypothetical protein